MLFFIGKYLFLFISFRFVSFLWSSLQISLCLLFFAALFFLPIKYNMLILRALSSIFTINTPVQKQQKNEKKLFTGGNPPMGFRISMPSCMDTRHGKRDARFALVGEQASKMSSNRRIETTQKQRINERNERQKERKKHKTKTNKKQVINSSVQKWGGPRSTQAHIKRCAISMVFEYIFPFRFLSLALSTHF